MDRTTIPSLLDSFDLYQDFVKESYFVLCYDCLPSILSLSVSMKESKQKMEEVMSHLDLEAANLLIKFKKWHTKDTKDADPDKDYPYQYFLQSESNALLVKIDLSSEQLDIDFLFDVNDKETENWIIETNNKLRGLYGDVKAPQFKVLTNNGKCYDTEDVDTENFEELDIESYYNDDFLEVDKIIQEGITKKKSGLILFHGEPGTGKTTYIKNMISKFRDKTFIFIQNEFVTDLLKPSFINFLLRYRDAVLIIEDAEKVIMSRENLNANSVVATILQLTDGLFSDYLNIKIICTFNTSLEKIDRALLRKGRMIVRYEFKPLAIEKASKVAQSLGMPPVGEDMALADIFNSDEKNFQDYSSKQKIGFR